MAQTPIGTSVPYCTVAKLFRYKNWQHIADLMRDGDNPRPSKMCLLDATSIEGEQLLDIGLAVCGEIESACFVGKRYSVADLLALTNSGKNRLEKLTADLWYYAVSERMQPGTADPEKIPGFKRALMALDQLESGERIFGLSESADAGLPSVSQPDASQQANPLIENSSRLFGTHRTSLRNRRPC
jgi:hypothetical protein